MAKVYILIFVIGILGVIGYGAKYYYDTTQNRIAVLTKNNATLKAAVETSESSIAELKGNIKKMGALNNKLQKDLQKAENYGDELRAKLNKLNLVVEALKDSKSLEGRMNGATAKIWRGIMEESGNTNEYDLPEWLQRSDSGSGNKDGNEDRTGNSTDSSKTETTPAQ